MSNSTPEKNSAGHTPGRFRLPITLVRVICQCFFFALFCFFVLVNTFGSEWFQKRGWPVNFFFNIDPLVAIASAISSHRLFGPLAWSLVIIVPTLFLGRFFCGWVCPFGAIHHFVGWAAGPHRTAAKIRANRYSGLFSIKYWILAFLLMMAVGNLLVNWVRLSRDWPYSVYLVTVGVLIFGIIFILRWRWGGNVRSLWYGLIIVAVLPVYMLLLAILSADTSDLTSLQIGLFDPICLLARTISTVFLPLADWPIEKIYAAQPLYQGAWLIAVVFMILTCANIFMPRFFCRVLCPLGALLGTFSRFSLWRIERSEKHCTSCKLCNSHCQGASSPSEQLRLSECLVCFDCLDDCPETAIAFAGPGNQPFALEPPTISVEPIVRPEISRRQLILAAIGGCMAVPLARLGGTTGRNWNSAVVRPPGSLPEEMFLQSCLKCGQCMRICPTNVLQPAGLPAGIEGLWTPILNNRIGRGCMTDCTACGQVCPTGAIRPISIEQKRGLGKFKQQGPLKLGTAFIDCGRCLPWAMDKPCSVCQEVCPVSPKAIFLRSTERVVNTSEMAAIAATAVSITTAGQDWKGDFYATGDHSCRIVSGSAKGQRRPIRANSGDTIFVPDARPFDPVPDAGSVFVIEVSLEVPYVDPHKCIGCGICQYESPVSGLRAIRVTAEDESRSKDRSLLLR